jgi:hypothetical protein
MILLSIMSRRFPTFIAVRLLSLIPICAGLAAMTAPWIFDERP